MNHNNYAFFDKDQYHNWTNDKLPVKNNIWKNQLTTLNHE